MTATVSGDRIEFLDVLRGVALLGILVVNVFSFGADLPAWTSSTDRFAWQLKHFFFESKFWALYSLLFGMGFYLQRQSGVFRWVHSLRRLGVLMAIGCLHALLFEGDILMLYAELGVLLLLVSRLPIRLLLVLAIALCLSFPLGHLWGPDRGDDWPATGVAEAESWLEDEREFSPLTADSMLSVIRYHAQFVPERFWVDWQYPDSGLLVFACFLFGFCLMQADPRLHTLLRLNNPLPVTIWLWLAGLSLMLLERALGLTHGYAPFERSAGPAFWILLGDFTYLLATVFLTLAWFMTIVVWIASERMRWLRVRIASAGKLSLSGYLTQTLIFSTVFYGYGYGAAFVWGPAAVLGLALVIYTLQVLIAHWWCQHFRYGPVEWLWRSLTYWQLSPLRMNRNL